jgi:hypothetical protein
MRDMTTQLYFSVVPPQVVDVVWPDAKKMLMKALDVQHGVYDIDSIHEGLKSSEFLLWLVIDSATPIAAITTRICIYPNGKGLAIDWMGGERMSEWLPMVQEAMERYARDNGCTHIEGYGRKAWGRWLQKYGWKPAYIAYKMELTDG